MPVTEEGIVIPDLLHPKIKTLFEVCIKQLLTALYVVLLLFTLIDVRYEGLNTCVPILVTLVGIVIEVSGQLQKASSPIVVRFDSSERFIEDNLLDP
jgi:hypothetical protein